MKQNISGDCRYLDSRRRVILPPHILAQANIPAETTLYLQVQNGCIVLRPIEGIAVRSLTESDKIEQKGRW